MKRRPRSPGPAANCRTQGTGLARVQLMLERRHLVMAFAHRGKARLDELANRGIEIPVGERALIFRLDMILAALDLGDDGVIVTLPGQHSPHTARKIGVSERRV